MIAKLMRKGTEHCVYSYSTTDKKPKFTDKSIENLMLERGLEVIRGSTRKQVKLNDEGFHEAFKNEGYAPFYHPDFFKWDFLNDANEEKSK